MKTIEKIEHFNNKYLVGLFCGYNENYNNFADNLWLVGVYVVNSFWDF